MTAAEVVRKARNATLRKVHYKLGAGGMDPYSNTPADALGFCDCSGFVSWALGRSRRTAHPLYVKFNGGWINTDGIVHDALNCTGFFTELKAAKVGALVVFPGHNPRRKIGHVGLVTELHPSAVLGVSKVIHCSMGNQRTFGQALKETPATVFNVPDVTFAWYEGLE